MDCKIKVKWNGFDNVHDNIFVGKQEIKDHDRNTTTSTTYTAVFTKSHYTQDELSLTIHHEVARNDTGEIVVSSANHQMSSVRDVCDWMNQCLLDHYGEDRNAEREVFFPVINELESLGKKHLF